MPNIVEISDFIGAAKIQKGTFNTDPFNSIRDEFSDDYIYRLLGVELGDLFLADLDANGVPQTARFITIFNAIKQDRDNGGILNSKGIKYYITMIVFFFYARNNNIAISLAGNKVTVSENSNNLVDQTKLVSDYNKGIDTAKAIQIFINEDSATYPEYNGQHLDYVIRR